jgi:hypothetical protein
VVDPDVPEVDWQHRHLFGRSPRFGWMLAVPIILIVLALGVTSAGSVRMRPAPPSAHTVHSAEAGALTARGPVYELDATMLFVSSAHHNT